MGAFSPPLHYNATDRLLNAPCAYMLFGAWMLSLFLTARFQEPLCAEMLPCFTICPGFLFFPSLSLSFLLSLGLPAMTFWFHASHEALAVAAFPPPFGWPVAAHLCVARRMALIPLVMEVCFGIFGPRPSPSL